MSPSASVSRPPESSGPADDASWDRVVAGCDYATFFHTRAWNVISASVPNPVFGRRLGRAAAWHVRFQGGVEAVLPAVLYRWARGSRTVAQSSGGGAYGGWIGNAGFTAAHEAAAWKALPWRHLEARRNPFAPADRAGRAPQRRHAETTAVIDLRCGFDAIAAGWRLREAPIHRNVRRATAAGIRVGLAQDAGEWETFREIYLENAKRWENPSLHPARTIAALEAAAPGAARLILARLEGTVVAGLLLLVHRRHGAGLVKAARPVGYKLNALNAVDAHTVRHCVEAGLWWYDMDTSTFSESVRIQKLRMGARELPADIEVHLPRLQHLLRRGREFLRNFSNPAGSPHDGEPEGREYKHII